MTWDEFVENVQCWAAERGIYEHSTPDAQLLKALSELGELADAIVKDDLEGIKDGVGDVAVCMVNFSKMRPQYSVDLNRRFTFDGQAVHDTIGIITIDIADLLIGREELRYSYVTNHLSLVAKTYGLNFLECCEHAWLQIKDRQGYMVPGGVFVKTDDESLRWASDVLKKATPEEIEQALAELEERCKKGD